MYLHAIKKGLGDTPFIELDAGALADRDFSGTAENLVLRGISETKSARTVFLIKDCEELDKHLLDDISTMLDYELRKRFKLFKPAISIDLSGAVFILFSSQKNPMLDALSDICDVVRAERLVQDEKLQAVRSVMKIRTRVFGLNTLVFEEGIDEMLAAYDVRCFRQIVDSTLRSAVYENSNVVTLECVKRLVKENNIVAPKKSKGLGFIGGEAG
jgi:ATP-dependent Lon protease